MPQEPITSENNQLLSVVLELAEQLLECGGEVSRVEDTIHRICTAYGAERTDVFVITSSIVVTMKRGSEIVTQTRRITNTSTNFERLEELNALSREICTDLPGIQRIQMKLKRPEKRRSPWWHLAGNIAAAGGFAVFFGGNLMDAFSATICGALIFLMDIYVQKLWNSRLVYVMICSIIAGFTALLMEKYGICMHVDKVMIGDIMLLIPGLALTNALRDLFMGDTISGMLRFMEALLQAGAIACGFALAVYLGGAIL